MAQELDRATDARAHASVEHPMPAGHGSLERCDWRRGHASSSLRSYFMRG